MAPKPQPTAPHPGRRRFALLLEYDGARFAGSQLQRNATSVQGVLEDAVEKATRQRERVAFAGRTDAGVHAYGQVASFLSDSLLDPQTMRRALNAWLPEDVAVRGVAEVALSFDPRRDALSRHYRYVIENASVRPTLDRLRVWYVGGVLDDEAMSRAARSVLGRHDFAAFASRFEDAAASTVRELTWFEVRREASRLICDVSANAFLPHQVRRMVGALVQAGRGRLSVADYEALLQAAPASAGPAAPPHGLYLMRVRYEIDPFAVHA